MGKLLDLTKDELQQLAKHHPMDDQQLLVCRLAQNHIDALKRLEAADELSDELNEQRKMWKRANDSRRTIITKIGDVLDSCDPSEESAESLFERIEALLPNTPTSTRKG